MKPWLLGLAGLFLLVGTALLELWFLSVPWIRNGYWGFLPLLGGVALAIAGLLRRRHWPTGILAALCTLAGVGYTAGRFMKAPSTAPAVAIGDRFPDLVLKAATGEDVLLSTLRAKGPLVVVLYRGHW